MSRGATAAAAALAEAKARLRVASGDEVGGMEAAHAVAASTIAQTEALLLVVERITELVETIDAPRGGPDLPSRFPLRAYVVTVHDRHHDGRLDSCGECAPALDALGGP